MTTELSTKSDLQYLQKRPHTDLGGRDCDENSEISQTEAIGNRLNSKFRTRIRNGIVDVWWLFEDGGLTLLLSYLLTTQNTYLPVSNFSIQNFEFFFIER